MHFFHFSQSLLFFQLFVTWKIYETYYVVVNYPDLSLVNGQITYDPLLLNNQHPLDSVASFECNYGYNITGPNSSTCETSGTWSQQSPMCIQGNYLTK